MFLLKKNFFILILISISAFIAFKNYTPQTFLSGWDTLHPEFNFSLNLSREIFGVFRGEQGLGAVTAHSHMSDLPRVFVLYLFHFFLPMNSLRYSYFFLNLLAGPIGMFFFLQRIIFKNSKNCNLFSFLGALFYLLNIGTAQQFYVPFEMFTTQYAVLPWIFLFSAEFIYSNKLFSTKQLILIAIAIIFSMPMAYASILWYVTFLALFIYLFGISIPSCLRRNFKMVKKILFLMSLIFFLNSFWMFPNIYFVINHGLEVSQANINKLFSEQAFLYNKEFGTIKDIALLKTFYFDWRIYTGNNNFISLLSPWISHLKDPFVEQVLIIFAVFSGFGVIFAFFKKHKALSLFPILLLCLFFLFNNNFPNSLIYNLLQNNFRLFKEGFRFPDDKVLGIYIFVFTVYFTLGQQAVSKIISSALRLKSSFQIQIVQVLQVLIFVFLLFYTALPVFQGNLISPYVRIKIPNEYFRMFDWFNNQKDDGKIANLPIQSFWGWEYYKWYQDQPSFQGSGFIWFGIKQPVLNRDFDRWSKYNEQYYREMSYAIYTQDENLFKNVLKKYNIHYIILDTSIIAPENQQKVLFYNEIINLLDHKNYLQKTKFGNFLSVYKVNNPQESGISLLTDFNTVSPAADALYQDFAFQTYGDYLTLNKGQSTYYPFRNIIDNQSNFLPERINLTQNGVNINLEKALPGKLGFLPYLSFEDVIASDVIVEKQEDKIITSLYPRFPFSQASKKPLPIVIEIPTANKQNLILSINQSSNFLIGDIPNRAPFSLGTVYLKTKTENSFSVYPSDKEKIIIPDFSQNIYTLDSCDQVNKDQLFGIKTQEKNFISFFSKNTNACMNIPLKNLIPGNLKEGSLMRISFGVKTDSSSDLCIRKLGNPGCIQYITKNIKPEASNTLSEYFSLKKGDIDNLGIKISLKAINSNREKSATYYNFKIGITDPIFNISIPQSAIRDSLASVDSSEINKYTLSFPFSGINELSRDITSDFKNNLGDCPSLYSNGKSLSKKEILKDGYDQFIRYSSREGSFCDHFSYQNLPQNQAYLIVVESRNIQGLPVRLCVSNWESKRCDIYSKLNNSKEFKEDIFLLPPMMGNGSGFDINIDNFAVERSPAVNDIKSINIIPFPYIWVSQIQSGKTKNNPKSKGLETIAVNPGSYLVSSDNYHKGEAIILHQAYEPGWTAYISNNPYFPFFGKEIKNHALVNNWENGFVIDSELPQNSKIVIIYTPQYLEYLGFFLLFFSLFLILIKSVKI